MDGPVQDGRLSPASRRAVAKLKDELGRSERDARLRAARGLDDQEVMRLSSIEEALAMVRFLRALQRGDPGGRIPRESLRLELEAHEGYKHASISLFRALMAARDDTPVGEIFTKAGRARTREEALSRWDQRIEELSEPLEREGPGRGYLTPRYAPWVVESREDAPSTGPLASRPELSRLERALRVLLAEDEDQGKG